ncbi:hypothetical protein [Gloeobacter morelensis]|uniref:hypothetical protein n=1 Tax=Gloeobacter morelensis TaxID=2907343 RepID=UPI001E4362EF|nr:hypothetical protein [Gloeobacter morelensis]UFP97224.1 hypothetical protein ISF26_24185 [Gloeobacter morelensis MG652769]
MADFIDGEKKKVNWLPLTIGGGVGILIIALGMFVLTANPRNEQTQQVELNEYKNVRKYSFDLTGQYFCYSQLSNLPPVYYQLMLTQTQNKITGEASILGGSTGTFAGNVDGLGRLQFDLTQVDSKGAGILPNLPIPGMGSGSKTTIFSFVGYHSKVGTNARLTGFSKNQTASNEMDAKSREFYCSTTRPGFWGNN